jgi:sec-independent protein translocase protein TatA
VPVLGFWDLLILLLVAVLIFGPKRLPQMGKSLGGSIRGFKDAIAERHEKQDAEAEAEAEAEAAKPAQLTQAVPTAPAAPPAQPAADPREHDTVL